MQDEDAIVGRGHPLVSPTKGTVGRLDRLGHHFARFGGGPHLVRVYVHGADATPEVGALIGPKCHPMTPVALRRPATVWAWPRLASKALGAFIAQGSHPQMDLSGVARTAAEGDSRIMCFAGISSNKLGCNTQSGKVQ